VCHLLRLNVRSSASRDGCMDSAAGSTVLTNSNTVRLGSCRPERPQPVHQHRSNSASPHSAAAAEHTEKRGPPIKGVAKTLRRNVRHG